MPPHVESFFDEPTSTFSHVVHGGPGTPCAIIDSVLGYDPKSGRTDTRAADAILDYVLQQGLSVQWLLETHAHADHLSGAAYLRERLGGRIGASEAIRQVQQVFRGIYNLPADYCAAHGQFDHLFQADEAFAIGELRARALHVPGHTPADLAFQVEEVLVFVGDTLFPPDVGTARCDFPGGSASQLYNSARRLLALPGETRLFMCHDYPPPGRQPIAECTVAEQRATNLHVRDGVGEGDFVAMRRQRDAQLDMPNLLLPSIQVNIRAGVLPEPEGNGVRYMKMPIDGL
ncbi:MBL fold metallo-hydrolase [Pseudomonas sp. Q1-7]|uniref:MBL fold metallo-hydrolase n=1 Tax=Pseudomonas sp. Q1-7 TaxID=3020843 RepID=UPI0022FFF16E|nr:MBL fold metallo-hydrolase [Pseudomonas sp. Q1-7]